MKKTTARHPETNAAITKQYPMWVTGPQKRVE